MYRLKEYNLRFPPAKRIQWLLENLHEADRQKFGKLIEQISYFSHLGYVRCFVYSERKYWKKVNSLSINVWKYKNR